MANERTFLAWMSTSIALMGFGFVIVKFALFILQVTRALGEKAIIPQKGYTAIIGVIMGAIGSVIATLALIHYRNIEKQLRANSYYPSSWLSVMVTLSIVSGGILLVLYRLLNT